MTIVAVNGGGNTPQGYQTDDAVTWTAIAVAESGVNPDAHNPHGEDSRGLWQINVDTLQTGLPGFAGGVRVASGDVNGATMDRIENLGIVLESDVSQTGDDGGLDVLVGVSGRDWNLSADTMTSGPDDDLNSPAVQKGTWIMDATFQDGATVATESISLEGHQCLVFFLG